MRVATNICIAAVLILKAVSDGACSSTEPSQTVPNPKTTQVELPFTGLRSTGGVAVDTAGNVYVTDSDNNRVLKLPAGSNTQVELPFTGLKGPLGVAVDTAGNVYVTDNTDTGNSRAVHRPKQSGGCGGGHRR